MYDKRKHIRPKAENGALNEVSTKTNLHLVMLSQNEPMYLSIFFRFNFW